MSNSTNSQADNLADIVNMSAIIEPVTISSLSIVIATLIISTLLIFIYYQVKRSLKGQLRHIKYQLNNAQLSPRKAAHILASLVHQQLLTKAQSNALEKLRFAPLNPTTKQIIEFINHVK